MLISRLAVTTASGCARRELAPAAAAWLHSSAAAAAAASSEAAAAAAAAGPAGTSASEPAEQQVRKAFSYCVNLVKTHDYENFLWVAQLPKELRAPVFALRAFNVETALIADHAKSEMLMHMRCQWWHDAVNGLYKGRPPAQPIMTALAEVLAAGHPLTRYRLQQIVATRQDDLTAAEPPASLAALERYADGTAGALLQLQLEAAGLGAASASAGTASAAHARAAEHAAAHLGRAVGLAALLRGTHAHAARRRVYLPADLLQQHGLSEADVLAGRDSEAMRDVVQAVASAAQGHLEEARRLRGDVPPPARPLFAPGVAAGMYLSALEKAQFNLHDQRMLRGGVDLLAYQLQLKWALLRGRY